MFCTPKNAHVLLGLAVVCLCVCVLMAKLLIKLQSLVGNDFHLKMKHQFSLGAKVSVSDVLGLGLILCTCLFTFPTILR